MLQKFFLSKILALGFSEKFIRTWEYYFDYSAAGFKPRTLANYQVISYSADIDLLYIINCV